jgi:hypothetical protein
MPTLRLDIVVLPTYNTYNIAVVDASTYPTTPPVVTSPTLQIDIPGFNTVTTGVNGVKDFVPAEANIFTSTDLGITTAGNECSLPDGVYYFKYTVNPAHTYYVEKTILRIDKLQQKYDEAFMQLDMIECDRAIKTQAKVDLMSICFIMQGAVAAANNCATVQSGTLYMQADKMLDNMIANDCGCSGVNYLINFQ